jgi:aspartyl aminopeptidase
MIKDSEFTDFLDSCADVYNTCDVIEQYLKNNGVNKLNLDEKWSLTDGHFYLKLDNQAIISFTIPKGFSFDTHRDAGARILASHIDYPMFRIKEKAQSIETPYVKYGIEVYGGPIISTWLDRPLKISGIVHYLLDNKIHSKTIVLDDLKGVIPNLAIHLNREVNKGFEYNKHKHLNVVIPNVLGVSKDTNLLESLVLAKLNIKESDLLNLELYLTPDSPATLLSNSKSSRLLLSKGLDNLLSTYAVLEAILDSEPNRLQFAVFYNHEEIGSQSLYGADSNYLMLIIDRILETLSLSNEEKFILKENSILASIDGVHALHPNFIEKHDSAYAPNLGEGVAIKKNVNMKYTSDAFTEAIFMQVVKKANIKHQVIINRSDIPSGSTIGPVASSLLAVKAIDLGVPMLAMHSTAELMDLSDLDDLIKFIKCFIKQ